MVLGADRIIELVRTPGKELPLLKNVDESQIEGIEGVSVDLRIDQVFVIDEDCNQPDVSLLRDSRTTPKFKELAFSHKKKEIWELYFHRYYLVQTMESINTPD